MGDSNQISESDHATKRIEELLRLEYQVINAGYVSRDQIVQDEFAKIVRIFSLLMTILLGLSIFIKVNLELHYFIVCIIGFIGVIAIIALIIDLQSTSSAKVALRKRACEIEAQLGESNVLVIWHRIENRDKHLLERLVKGAKGHQLDQNEAEGNFFILASLILLAMWVLVAVAILVYGPTITFSIHV